MTTTTENHTNDRMPTREHPNVVLRWETIGVTALPPGWVNVYTDENGLWAEPAPAMLLQEVTSATHCWWEGSRFCETIRSRDRETRVVYATGCGLEDGTTSDGELVEASLIEGYLGCTTEADFARRQAKSAEEAQP